MATPPSHMRRGLDAGLARALETTRDVLFRDYVLIEPEATARISFHMDQVYPLPTDPTELLLYPLRTVLDAVVARLHPHEAVMVAEYAIRLVLRKNDSRRAEFEGLRARLIWEGTSVTETSFSPEEVKIALDIYLPKGVKRHKP